jgi:hypothetical protein
MKRKHLLALGALVIAAATVVTMGAGGGWRGLADTLADWIDGRGASARVNAANSDRQSTVDEQINNGITPRHAGAVLRTASTEDSRRAAEAMNNDPRAQLAAAEQRYARAKEIFDDYRKQTEYPFESRPAREHADQMYPNRPVVEDQKLTSPGQKPSQTVRIRTSQERVYVEGDESVSYTIAAFDSEGNALPIAFTRAVALDPPKDGKPSKRQPVALPFGDEGINGDIVVNDFTYSARLTPKSQGFDNFSGTIRVELHLKIADQTGFTFFDIFYTPEPPAKWTATPREAVEKGSLNFYLPADVRVAGRYVITGRIDDAKGQPFALVSFNEEITAGARDFKLNLFGKLLVDEKPAFPLTLRDVDGFLLIQDADPDRALMSRRQGRQLVTKNHAIELFSEAEWDSEERRRYLAEYGKDVEAARVHLEHVRRSMKP